MNWQEKYVLDIINDLSQPEGMRLMAQDWLAMQADNARAAESMGKMQAKIDEQACTITAIAVERDALRQEKMYLGGRLDESRKRVEIAAVCLDDMPQLSPQVAKHVDAAKSVLEEKDLRRECESCNGPCNVAGDTCLLCGASQPKDESGPGIENCVAGDLNRARK